MSRRHERGVLDTSTVIQLSRVEDASRLPDEPLIGAITLAELAVGPLVSDDPSVRAIREAHLQGAQRPAGADGPVPVEARGPGHAPNQPAPALGGKDAVIGPDCPAGRAGIEEPVRARDVAISFGLVEDPDKPISPSWSRFLSFALTMVVLFGLAGWLGWIPVLVALAVAFIVASPIARRL